MKIQEVEKVLNIPRANIRFYEKEGLIFPKREKNSYREYSDEDIMQLKRIIVFRKIGVSIGDIKRLMNGELTLNEALENSEENLISQIDELNSALKLLKDMKKLETDFASVDENYYYNKITNSEKSGDIFIDISKDYIEFEKNIFLDMWKNVFLFDMRKIDKKHGFLGVLAIAAVICFARGFMAQFVWKNQTFFEAFFYPLFLFLVGSAITAPLYILAKKKPKAANIVSTVILIVAGLILTFVFGLLIFCIVKCLFSLISDAFK